MGTKLDWPMRGTTQHSHHERGGWDAELAPRCRLAEQNTWMAGLSSWRG